MVQGEASSVLVRNDERRAVYRIFDAEAAADALDQRRLSDAEGAKQKQHVTGLGDRAQLGAEAPGRLLAARLEAETFRHGFPYPRLLWDRAG